MEAPAWRIWLVTLLLILWLVLAVRLYAVKHDNFMAILCVVMALFEAYLLYEMTYGWRSKRGTERRNLPPDEDGPQ